MNGMNPSVILFLAKKEPEHKYMHSVAQTKSLNLHSHVKTNRKLLQRKKANAMWANECKKINSNLRAKKLMCDNL